MARYDARFRQIIQRTEPKKEPVDSRHLAYGRRPSWATRTKNPNQKIRPRNRKKRPKKTATVTVDSDADTCFGRTAAVLDRPFCSRNKRREDGPTVTLLRRKNAKRAGQMATRGGTHRLSAGGNVRFARCNILIHSIKTLEFGSSATTGVCGFSSSFLFLFLNRT